MPFRTITKDDLGLQYALISFDPDGNERTDDPAGGRMSTLLVQKAATEKPTNIFLFSHGWKGDFDAAVDQYDRWIGAMWKLEKDRNEMGSDFRPMFIGLHWPSLPWGNENMPGAASFAEAVLSPDYEALYEKTVQHFGDKPGVRDALRTIFNAQKDDPGAVSLPDDVIVAYKQLADAIGFSAGGGPGAAPDAEGEPLDPEEAVRAIRVASAAVPFGTGGLSGFFSGILGGLQQLSFWTMKKRARTVGEGGMHRFVAALQNACDARIHLMGHSFGCAVMSGVVGGPGGNTKLPRPIDSLALVQGAISLWSYGDSVFNSGTPGYFNNILKNACVSGSIITTQSRLDTAVGTYYPAAVGLVGEAAFDVVQLPKYGALGTFGIRGTNTPAQAISMLAHDGSYGFKPGLVYNIESSEFIKKMDGQSGAHNDIDGPEVAHALWQAALASAKGQGA
jgi:hypothetical protein